MEETISKQTAKAFRTGRKISFGQYKYPPDNQVESWFRWSWDDTFTGVRNPRYRDQIRQVTSATTPASGYRRTYSIKSGSGKAKWHTTDVNQNGDSERHWQCESYIPDVFSYRSYAPLPRDPSQPSADNKAIEKLQEQLISFESAALSGEDLGEISQTARMLRSPLKSLRGLMTGTLENHRRALGQKGVNRIARALGDTVLEYNFGITPIVNTLAEGLVAFKNRDYMAHYYPFHALGKDITAANGVFGDSLGNLEVDINFVRTKSCVVVYQGVWGVQTGVDRRSVNDILRLRWRDVIPTVWNLIPYSFLADYVTNLGVIADSYSVPWGGVRWCNKTIRQESFDSAETGKLRKPDPGYSWSGDLSPCHTSVHEVSFSRVNQAVQPRASLEIDFQLSPKQLLNVAALLVTQLPVVSALTRGTLVRHPDLHTAFTLEVGRRGIKSPYPFH